MKLDVESDKAVSTFSNVAYVIVEIHNVDSTLPNVATSYQSKNNVETTLKCLLGIRRSWKRLMLVFNCSVFLKYWQKLTTCSFLLKVFLSSMGICREQTFFWQSTILLEDWKFLFQIDWTHNFQTEILQEEFQNPITASFGQLSRGTGTVKTYINCCWD